MGRNSALSIEEWRPRWPPLRVHSTNLLSRGFLGFRFIALPTTRQPTGLSIRRRLRMRSRSHLCAHVVSSAAPPTRISEKGDLAPAVVARRAAHIRRLRAALKKEGKAGKTGQHSANTRAGSQAQKKERQAPHKLEELGASRDGKAPPRLQRNVWNKTCGIFWALRINLDMKSLLKWLVALVFAILLGFYTGIKIPTNPADRFALILGGKPDFSPTLGHALDWPLPLQCRYQPQRWNPGHFSNTKLGFTSFGPTA